MSFARGFLDQTDKNASTRRDNLRLWNEFKKANPEATLEELQSYVDSLGGPYNSISSEDATQQIANRNAQTRQQNEAKRQRETLVSNIGLRDSLRNAAKDIRGSYRGDVDDYGEDERKKMTDQLRLAFPQLGNVINDSDLSGMFTQQKMRTQRLERMAKDRPVIEQMAQQGQTVADIVRQTGLSKSDVQPLWKTITAELDQKKQDRAELLKNQERKSRAEVQTYTNTLATSPGLQNLILGGADRETITEHIRTNAGYVFKDDKRINDIVDMALATAIATADRTRNTNRIAAQDKEASALTSAQKDAESTNEEIRKTLLESSDPRDSIVGNIISRLPEGALMSYEEVTVLSSLVDNATRDLENNAGAIDKARETIVPEILKSNAYKELSKQVSRRTQDFKKRKLEAKKSDRLVTVKEFKSSNEKSIKTSAGEYEAGVKRIMDNTATSHAEKILLLRATGSSLVRKLQTGKQLTARRMKQRYIFSSGEQIPNNDDIEQWVSKFDEVKQMGITDLKNKENYLIKQMADEYENQFLSFENEATTNGKVRNELFNWAGFVEVLGVEDNEAGYEIMRRVVKQIKGWPEFQ